MQNSTFLELLRSILAPKMETPPPKGLESRAHLKLVRKSDWSLVKTFFFEIANFGRKNRLNFGKDLLFIFFFFWRSLDFDKKTASIWFKTDENLGQACLLWFQASKKPPHPLCEILATRLNEINSDFAFKKIWNITIEMETTWDSHFQQ